MQELYFVLNQGSHCSWFSGATANYLLPSDVFLRILEPVNLACFLDSTKRTVDLPALPKGKEDWGVSALPTMLTSSLGQGHSYPLQLVKGHSLFKSQIKHHFLQETFSDTQNRWSSLSISSNCSLYFPFIVVITLCHYSKLTHIQLLLMLVKNGQVLAVSYGPT